MMIAAYVVVSEMLLISHIKNSITIFCFVVPQILYPKPNGGGIHIAQEINVTEDTKHLSRHRVLMF